MKRFISLISVLLLTVLLASCTGNGLGGGTDPDNLHNDIVYTIDSSYIFVRAEKIDKASLDSAVALRKSIRDDHGVDLDFISDWTMENRDNNTVESSAEVHEILIGNTNRAETRNIAEEFKDMAHGYVIRAVNGKIVIWGSNDETLKYAIDHFKNVILAEHGLKMDESFSHVWDLNAEGMPIDVIKKEYSLIYSGSDPDRVWSATNLLAGDLEKITGVKFASQKDTAVTGGSGKEILIGLTNREESQSAAKGLGYSDYTIRVMNGKVIVLGGSPLATQSAVRKFTSLLTTDALKLEDGIIFEYDFDKYIENSIIHNIASFVPVWANEFTPPEWMLDYEEKLRTLTTSQGRISSDAHRGDTQNYPENSLEGVLSALLMGADVVEVDVRLTKDNIMVLMHDASLKRTTDWSKKSGSNGLPTSDQIEDWTYEQLLELRLLYNGKATDYTIPTLYEIATVCAKRGQIHLDRKAEEIDVNTDIYLLAEATGSKESFLYYYGMETMRLWMNKNADDKEFADFYAKMKKLLVGSSLRRRNTSVYDDYADAPDGWKKCFAAGYPKMLTNKIYDFCRFSAAEQQPTK